MNARDRPATLVVPGHPVASPSGRYKLEIIEGSYGSGEAWTCHGLGPSAIVSGEPRVPKLLVDRHPEDFGPRGRQEALRVLREQGPSATIPPDSQTLDDPRLKKPK